MGNRYRAGLTLDNVPPTIPRFQPERSIRAAAVPSHICEKPGQLVPDQHHAARPCLKQSRQSLNGRIGSVETWFDKIAGIDGIKRHDRRVFRRDSIKRGLPLVLPFFHGFLGLLGQRFMGKSLLADISRVCLLD